MKEMLKVQGREGTWNYDPYSHGMFNGMELVVALAEGRDPVFRKAPEKWIYTAPPKQEEGCAECGKKSSEGWALYCVKCLEREWINLSLQEREKIREEYSDNPSGLISVVQMMLKEKNT